MTNRHGKNRSATRRMGHKLPAPGDRRIYDVEAEEPECEDECPAGGEHVYEEKEEWGTGRTGWGCQECGAPPPEWTDAQLDEAEAFDDSFWLDGEP